MASSEASQLSLENLSFGLAMANGHLGVSRISVLQVQTVVAQPAGVPRTAWKKEGKVVILYALRSLFPTFHLSGFTWPVTRHQRAVHP